jgi:hypothetical protein
LRGLFLFHYDLRFAEISVRAVHRLAQFAWTSVFRWAPTVLELYTSRLGHVHGGSWGRAHELQERSRDGLDPILRKVGGHERLELV